MRIAHGKCDIGRRKSAILFGVVLVLTLVSAGTCHGQAPSYNVFGLPQGAGSGQPPAQPVVAPLLWKEDPLGKGMTLPTSCSPNEDNNGRLLEQPMPVATLSDGVPTVTTYLLDGGPTGIPGWVAGTEVGVVVPHVMNRLFDTVTRASGATSTVQLPSAQIDAAVMPRFELGYRFGQAAGELILSYRFVTGQATDFASANVVPAFGPNGAAVTSRLNLNNLDLDYGSWEPITVLGVNMKWRVGLRGLLEYNDSEANNGMLAQSTNNHYLGLGPHAMVDFRRPIAGTEFALFGRIEAAMVWGSLQQNYTDSVTTGGVTDFGQTHEHIYSQITSLALQAGVSWTPHWNPNFHVSAGYIFEHFWDLGSLAVGLASREELDINGGFVRAEWNY